MPLTGSGRKLPNARTYLAWECRLIGLSSLPPQGDKYVAEFSFFARAAALSVAEIVALTGAEPCEGADLSRRLTGIAPVDQAGADDLTFVAEAKFADALKSTRAGAVLTTERFASHAP